MLTLPLTQQNVYALKTVCGAIYYSLTRYKQTDIYDWEWQYVRGYLYLPPDTIYSIEKESTGFLMSTRYFKFRYIDHAYHENRVIQIIV